MQVTETFDRAMAVFGPFEQAPVFGVALSGGADSTALCLLAARYARERGGNILALIVNHGLRSCAKAEAQQVGEWCARHGFPYEILTMSPSFSTRIEERARAGRYALLTKACLKHGIVHLLTGHHADDQAETVLMRQEKKSGVIGLAGMASRVYLPFGEILRPLLSVSHADLCAFNRSVHERWVEDETNAGNANERGRLRAVMTDERRTRALETAEKARQARTILEQNAARTVGRHLYVDASGGVTVARSALERFSVECFGAVLRFAGNEAYAPSPLKTAALLKKMTTNGFKGASLGRCGVFPSGRNAFYVCREKNACGDDVVLTASTSGKWDAWTWVFDCSQTGVLRALKDERPSFFKKTGIPKRRFSTLPAFFTKQGLFLVPHLEYKREETAFRLFLTPENSVCPHGLTAVTQKVNI